ncbi:hypothetical protein P7N58_001709, partial [Pseudomonas aeruginosa]
MFIRLRAIYNRALDAYNAGSNKTRRQLAALKRYPCAAVSAYQAARAFLATPSHENLFQPLTPVLIEPGKIQRYERELLNGLKNDQVRNIAITGEYGAGKSSVLRTFVHRHPEFVYAFVSLATFGKDTEIAGAYELVTDTDLASESPRSSESPAKAGQESKSEENKAESDLVARIEETIVQQLLYSVPCDTRSVSPTPSCRASLEDFREEIARLGIHPQEPKPAQKSIAFKDLPQRRWQPQ